MNRDVLLALGIGITFVVAGAAIVGIGLKVWRRHNAIRSQGRKVVADVVGYDFDFAGEFPAYHPTVRFEDEKGMVHELRSKIGGRRIGDGGRQVSVIYMPADPTQFLIEDYGSGTRRSLRLLVALGTTFIVIGALSIYLSRDVAARKLSARPEVAPAPSAVNP